MPPPTPRPPPAPQPPPAPPKKRVGLTLESRIGADGTEGVQALRTALDGAQDALVTCFPAPGSVSLELTVGKPGDIRSVSTTTGDPAVAACVTGVVSGLHTARVPWATKIGLTVAFAP